MIFVPCLLVKVQTKYAHLPDIKAGTFPTLLHALTYKSVLYLYFRVEHRFHNTSDQITKGLLSI